MTKLSIIIPVYNVEKYIRPCFESIFKQELDDTDFEIIIVNDGTTDHSMEVIADIIQSHNNIIIINQENQGLSLARNKGITKARGEYLLMLDSDDLLIDNCLKPLLEAAFTSKADMVITDYKQLKDTEIENFTKRTSQIIQKELKFIEATGIDLLYECLIPYYWRHLFRREFLNKNHISFIPGIIAQDIAFTNECMLKAKKCIRAKWTMIIYRCRDTSVSFSTYNVKKAKNYCVAIAKIWELSKLEGLSTITRRKQIDIVFRYFRSLTFKITYGHIKDITQITEVIDYMKQLAPDLEFKNGFKQRFYTWMYRHTPHTFLLSRYYLIMFKKKCRSVS